MFASVLASPKKIIGSLVRRLRHPASKPTVSVKPGPAKPALKKCPPVHRTGLPGSSTPVARPSPLRHNDSLMLLREKTSVERVVPIHGVSGDTLEALKREREHYNTVIERRQQERRRAALKAHRPATQPSKTRTRSLSDRKEAIARRESSLSKIPGTSGRNVFRAPSTASSSSSFTSVTSSATVTPSTVPSSSSSASVRGIYHSFPARGATKVHLPLERFGSLITERGSLPIPLPLDQDQEPVKSICQLEPDEPQRPFERRAAAPNASQTESEPWVKAAEQAIKVQRAYPPNTPSSRAPFTPSRTSGSPRKAPSTVPAGEAPSSPSTAASLGPSPAAAPSPTCDEPAVVPEHTPENQAQIPRGSIARDFSFMKVDAHDPNEYQPASSSNGPRPLARGPTVVMGEASFTQSLSREPSIMEIDRSFSFDSMDIESDIGNREFTPMDFEGPTGGDPMYIAYDQACDWIRTAPAGSLRYRDIPWPVHDPSVDLGGNWDGILQFFCGHPRIGFGATGREEFNDSGFKQRLFQEYYQRWRHARFPWDKVHADDEVEVAYGVDVVEQCILKYVNER
ncbi:hypothetical protein BKA70DRAFT_1440829 [Coprinopsis sp. MPI-PUGE-AT-0042]|nr:hypothetical protein BKA70DRAFT_1440829 [Coprinopsis sp. MPI-PUGE-AT-0042]